jgi:hypothetical protein
MDEMRTKRAAGINLSPQKYAELVGRSPQRMPTALGKPVWRCSAAELQRLEAWQLALAGLLARIEEGARGGIDCRLSSDEQQMLDRHRDLQRALWRWALGN